MIPSQFDEFAGEDVAVLLREKEPMPVCSPHCRISAWSGGVDTWVSGSLNDTAALIFASADSMDWGSITTMLPIMWLRARYESRLRRRNSSGYSGLRVRAATGSASIKNAGSGFGTTLSNRRTQR